jgi:hypothetical protein
MKKILLIVLLFVSIGATAQSRIISGIGERPAGITAARQWLYFNSPQGEYTNFEISVSCEGSGQIYYFTFETFRDFQHNYQLPATGFTYVATFFCYNYTTGNFQTFTKTIEL